MLLIHCVVHVLICSTGVLVHVIESPVNCVVRVEQRRRHVLPRSVTESVPQVNTLKRKTQAKRMN